MYPVRFAEVLKLQNTGENLSKLVHGFVTSSFFSDKTQTHLQNYVEEQLGIIPPSNNSSYN